MNARELAHYLAAAMAEWEPIPGVPFPSEREHQEACERLSVRASDPSSWSRQYLQRLTQDRVRRVALSPLTAPISPEPGQEQAKADGGPGVAAASPCRRATA